MSYTLLDAVHDYKFSQDLLDRILDTKSWDSVVAFLIAIISPSAESITIDNFGASRCTDISSVLEVLASQQGLSGGSDPFSQLHEVRLLQGTRDKSPRNHIIWNALPFLRLKSVANFLISGLDAASIPQPYMTTVFSAPSLELQNCQMPTDVLSLFLGRFQTLRRWKWSTQYAEHSEDVDIGRNLPTLRAKLEELVVDNKNGYGSDHWRDHYGATTFEDVSNSRALKKIEVDSASALGGIQMRHLLDSKGVNMESFEAYAVDRINNFLAALPESLECLKITACHHRIFDCVPVIIGLKGWKLPQFRELKLGFVKCQWNAIRAQSQSMVDACVHLCNEASVKLMVLLEEDY
ncbi:hypothetical protein BDZ45DRAFT_683774 [Acephala macrosclerotiorum]|nr:hypothetical protein BDZ45DRAFT_683774 [Acephala macrosclerotiorum]